MCFKLNSLEVFAQAFQAFLNAASWDPLLGNRRSDGLVCFSWRSGILLKSGMVLKWGYSCFLKWAAGPTVGIQGFQKVIWS